MKVRRLIELLQKEDPDANAVIRDEHYFYPVATLQKRLLEPTNIRDRYTNELMPGYKDTMKNEKATICILLEP